MAKPKKKKKQEQSDVLSASEISHYIWQKFDKEDEEFWNWLMDNIDYGQIVELSVHKDDYKFIPSNLKDYYNTVKNEFSFAATEEHMLQINNDL